MTGPRFGKEVWVGAGAIVAVMLVLGFATRLRQHPLPDEVDYHLPVIEQFANAFPRVDLRGYASASGPVPYVVWAAAAQVTGAGLAPMRLVTTVWMLVLLAGVVGLSRGEKNRHLPLLAPLVLLTPYAVPYGFTIYTMIPALALATWGLLLVRAPNGRRTVWGGVLLSLAVASRQFYVAYPVGLLAASVFSGSPRPLSRMVALFLPLGTLMLLALVWGGLTPPAMQQKFGHRSIHPEQFGFFLLWLGFWFAPVALDTIRRSPRMLWIGAVGLALAIVLGVDYAQAAGETEGVLPKLLAGMTAAGAPAPLVKSGQAILVGSGCLVATRLFRAPDRDLVWIAAVHAGIMLTVPYAWERYYLPVTPVIWLALLPGTTSWGTRWLTVWASVQTVLTLAYCAYKWGWRFP